MPAGPPFRLDIQYLRALAVTLVVLFHANPHWMPGGFLGVDIFFVISGYVIFQQIERQYAAGTFTLISFYQRRAKRLFPALFVTILACSIITPLMLHPLYTENFHESALWSIFFVPNIFFYLDSGYFSADANLKPLLHLWSLGVEEQFYLVFPVVISFILGRGRTALILFLTAGIILGTCLSIYLTETNPAAAFYLSPVRFFQFLMGASVVPLSRARISPEFASAIWRLGLTVIILACAWFYDETTALPGWRVLPLCLLTMFMLYAGEHTEFHARGVFRRLSLSIGNASYSIYLAHWPAAVFLGYWYAGHNEQLVGLAVMAAGLLFGALLYKLVECPFRYRSLLPTSIVLATSLTLVLVIAFASMEPGKPDSNYPTHSSIDGPTLSEPVYLFGDSHAGALSSGIRSVIGNRAELVKMHLPDCPPLVGLHKRASHPTAAQNEKPCAEAKERWIETLRQSDHGTIVIASRWELLHVDAVQGHPQGRIDWLVPDNHWNRPFSPEQNLRGIGYGLEKTIELAAGRTIILIGNVPLQPRKSIVCANRKSEIGITDDRRISEMCGAVPSSDAAARYRSVNELLITVADRHQNVKFVDPMGLICSGQYCDLTSNGQPLYRDDNHVNELGARLIALKAISPNFPDPQNLPGQATAFHNQ